MKSIALVLAALSPLALAQTPAQATPPTTWVDKDTGHRIHRLTNEPGSSAFYFNVNAYTPDHRTMVYTAPDGIHTLDMKTFATRLLVPNPPRPPRAPSDQRDGFRGGLHTIVVGHKTNSVFFTKTDPDTRISTVFSANTDTGEVTRLTDLPKGAGISSVNADETLAAGTFDEHPAQAAATNYNRTAPTGTEPGPLVQPESKGQMMERRLASRTPVVFFTINLHTGKIFELLHSTDWIGHILFSPTDPSLIMYCHEGPWQKVDRIWMIHTDGTHNTLIHKRHIAMEIAGHEFWGLDGETIWYDWQPIKGQDFYLAGLNLKTGKRTAFHMDRNDWSIHFNLTQDLDIFTGDGGDPGQVAHAPDGEWIELFHPTTIPVSADTLNEPDFFQPGYFQPEHLVNMSHHNYRLEPNVRFSPDKKLVLFTTNMFGPSYVLGVEVDKATPGATDIESTPALATKFNPTKPVPTGSTDTNPPK